ncbi:MAG: YfhO family protein [Candidatus Parcubacteria bacterium]|nr:YfhO family protein [Candidatus Parcubacteria bacterium]
MKNKIINYWPVIIVFMIWFIFAGPYFLKNKVPFPSNYQVNNFAPWSTNSKFWGPVKNSAMPDIITQIYPWRHLAIETWKQGQVPLWNPYTFSGNPLLANYQSAVLSPLNLLFFILPFVDAWSILVLFQPLLAGLFMYLFVRSLKVSNVGALISSISFMFCGFITAWMGYATLGYAILFLPFSLFCIEKYFETKRRIFLFLLSLTFPLSFFSGHFQISLYFLIAILSYVVYKLIVSKNIHNTLYVILYTFFGLLLIMPQILPSIELYLESFRNSFFQIGGISVGYLPSFLAPDFFGNPVTRNTWFGHYAEWNAYIGLVPLMLAIYSLLRIKNHQTLFFSIFGLLSLALAISNPASVFIQNLHIPILSTASINRIIVLFSFSFAVLAGFGCDQLHLDIKKVNTKIIFAWLSLFGFLFVILWIVIFQKLFIPLDKIAISKQNLILPTTFFLAVFALVFLAVIFRKIKPNRVMYVLLSSGFVILIAFDMLRFATKWMPFDPKNLVFPNFSTTQALSKISGFERIFGNLGGEATMYYGLPSVEGYDALYSKRYGQFIGYIDSEELIESNWSVVLFPKNSKNTSKAINLLDIKYIVHKLTDDGVSWTFPYWIYPKGQFDLVYKDNYYRFYQNNSVIPHAFLVGEYRVIKDKKQILKTIFSDEFNPRKEIVLEDDPKIIKTNGDVGEAKIINYQPSNIDISVESKNNVLLFLAENYDKGWKASVDGKNVPILRANYTFRAVEISNGKHNVKFWYDPWSFRLGVYLATGGLVGIFVTLFLISRNTNRLKSASS